MKLKIRGIKGITGDFDLGPRTMLTGPMGSGKSGVLAAVHLALLGNFPALGLNSKGTQSAALLRLYADDGAMVELTANGTTIKRRVEYTAQSARLVTEATRDGKTKEGAEADELIAELRPDVLFADFGLFVSANARERKEMLLSYFPDMEGPDGLRWMQCHAYAAVSDIGKGGTTTDRVRHTPDFLRTYRTSALRLIEECEGLDELVRLLEEDSMTLAERIEAIHTEAKAVENDRKARTKAIEGIASIDLSEVKELAGELPGLQERLAELDKEAARVAEQRRRSTEAADRKAKLEQRIVDLEGRMAQPSSSLMTEADEADARKRLGGLQVKAEAHRLARPDIASTEKAQRELQDTLRQAREAVETIRQDGKAKAAAYEARKAGNCPTCSQPWDKAQEEAEALRAELVGLKAAMTEARDTLAALEAQEAAVRQQRDTGDKAVEDWRKATAQLAADVEGLETVLRRHELAKEDAANVAARLDEARKDLADWTEVAAVDEEYEAALADQRKGLEEKIDEAQRAAAKVEVIAGANLDAVTLAAKLWKAAHKAVVEGRNAYMQSKMSKLQRAGQDAVLALAIGDEFVLDVTGKDIEIGVKRGDKLIDLMALSRGQQVMFAAAMLSSLPRRQGESLRVMTVEAIEAMSHTKRLADWLAGSDADVVVLATQAGVTDGEEWQMVRMGEVE